MRNGQLQQQGKFVWNGPTGDPLKQRFGKPAPVVFFEMANQIRRDHKIYGPPFNPYDYANAMGVAVEEVADMPMDGLLMQKESGCFVVHLRKDVCQSRKNFTLAHELAHTFFYNELMENSPKFRGNHKADPVEEALCNIGARELLMPRPIFKRDLKSHLQDGLVTPLTMIHLADRYEVSLQAVAITITSIEKNITCAMWERSGRTVNMRWVAPISTGRLILCLTGKSSIELAFRGPPGDLVTANDSFYRTGGSRRRIIRETFSQKSVNGAVFSVMLPRSQCPKTVGEKNQPTVSEHWWHRY